MKLKTLGQVILSIIICEAAGLIGSIFTTPNIPTWYATLQKPSFAPPNWVFGPVWTTLFALMGIAAYLVWRRGTKNKIVKSALFIFGCQLALNIMWSVLFFGLQSPEAAFVEIIILWLAIALSIRAFFKVSKPAAYLLLPYIAWVTFAGFLNYMIAVLN